MGGERIDSNIELMDTIAYTPPGDKVVFDVWRDRHLVSVRVVIGRQPEGFSTRGTDRAEPQEGSETEDAGERPEELPALGIEVRTLDRELASNYDLEQVARAGVVVTRVTPDGPAAEKDVQAGDVIVALDGNRVRNVEELKSQLDNRDTPQTLDLRLRNRKGSRHVRIRLEQQ
jgi:serine protease Do